ncbi:MAG TPA: hypothetical protein VGR27_05675 [Longimicrobiaceae bacterium]|nr:hypothetical protein [Longimicrobiaceae bacterium]
MSDEKKSPKTAEEQDSPQQVRPTNTQEEAGQGPENKPSQAEGERDKVGE